MTTTEQFSLRWNNFHSNLTSGFYELLEASDMVDVTLAVEGHFLQAHKIVLSICSPYFKQLFKLNPCKHPIVILKDVAHGNMKDILEFMYLGEVNVLRENLPAFLRTAELLQVKGLTGDDSNDTSKKDEKLESVSETDYEADYNHLLDKESTAMSQVTSISLPEEKHNISFKRHKKNIYGNLNLKRTKFESEQIPSDRNKVKSEECQINDDESEFIEVSSKLDENYDKDQILINNEHYLLDSNMGSSGASDSNLQDHGKLEAKCKTHLFRCDKCTKSFTRRDHLRTHEKNIHGEDAGPFACVICSQLYKNSESLRKHIAKFHYQKMYDSQKLPKVEVNA